MATEPNDRFARILKKLGELGDELLEASADELEEISDLLIDELLDRIPLPRFVPFVRGWLRKKLDELIPEQLFRAIASAVLAAKQKRAMSSRIIGPQ